MPLGRGDRRSSRQEEHSEAGTLPVSDPWAVSMSAERSLGARVVLVAAAVSIGVLGSVHSVAQSRSGAPASTQVNAAPRAKSGAPLRAIFYSAAPVTSKRARLPASAARLGLRARIARDLAALRWARADAAIVPWSPSPAADRKFGAVLAVIRSSHARLHAAALIRQQGALSKVSALASKRASGPAYLRVGKRPALFVALSNRARRSCAEARRWRVAASAYWLAQATFAGYAACQGAADAWYSDAHSTRGSRAPGTYLIRPGIWLSSAKVPRLRRTVPAWKATVQRMNSSGARVQLIDSLDDWAHGTAIEPSRSWPSHSGFGRYLDALHAHPTAHAPFDALPTVASVAFSGATARTVAVVANVAPGSDASKWWVEYGSTTAYGQAGPPVAVRASRSPKPATTTLTGLAPAVTYHARVVVASAAGVIASRDTTFATLAEARAMRVAAAGDIACDPASSAFKGGAGTSTECHQGGVSNAILAGGYDAVLALGDTQYNSGTASQYAGSYEPSWGRFRAITHPAVGNHEYGSPNAAPYFAYFGVAAGDPAKGYYSYDLGAWHIIVLNANCTQIGGCHAGSAQELWLRSDLAAHPVGCTLAYWHQPRFSSGQHGDDTLTSAFWDDLYAAGAELVLSGHDHDYERFAPQTNQAARDDARGIREFVVGTGGVNHMTFKPPIHANSEVRDASTFGYLELTLSDGSYAWKFVPDPPGGFTDAGTGTCH
jgi:acid phosphatase type 7